jgi:hypothetical protein
MGILPERIGVVSIVARLKNMSEPKNDSAADCLTDSVSPVSIYFRPVYLQ